MTRQNTKTQDNTSVVTSDDLARRFLGDAMEKEIRKVTEPIEVEVDGLELNFDFKFGAKVNSLSARILWTGAAIVIAHAIVAAFN